MQFKIKKGVKKWYFFLEDGDEKIAMSVYFETKDETRKAIEAMKEHCKDAEIVD